VPPAATRDSPILAMAPPPTLTNKRPEIVIIAIN
jgi:hypothetical protein